MKMCLLLAFVLVVISPIQAQTLVEFTEQKKTQIKYLVEQIAALNVYMSYVEKGYDIAQEGLSVIHSIKKGDFELHAGYFTSLITVNPKIKEYAKVSDIIGMQLNMTKHYQSSIRQMKSSGWFTADEISYKTNVFLELLNNSNDLLDQLSILTTNGQVQMKDNERIQRIDQLYEVAKDQYSFEQSFTSGLQLLALQRAKENNETKKLKSLYGVTK